MAQRLEDFSRVQMLLVRDGEQGQRIDNYLTRILKGVPRSRIYRILRKGEVRVNKGRVAAGYRVQAGDNVRLPPLRIAERPDPGRPAQGLLDALERAVVYEDDRMLVLNKPSGVAVHGGSGVGFGVIEGLRALRPADRDLELVHRLDRETSGCLVIARRRSALRTLHELFREGGVDKRYLALVAGRWKRGSAEVGLPLRKNTLRGGERVVRLDAGGKPARTRFRVLRRLAQATLVEARPETGRTHQIRVHAASLGTPILGDAKYGDPGANRAAREAGLRRLFLHAASLAFTWPGEEGQRLVEAPLPGDLEAFLEKVETR